MTDDQRPEVPTVPPAELVVEPGDIWALWWRAFEARHADGEHGDD